MPPKTEHPVRLPARMQSLAAERLAANLTAPQQSYKRKVCLSGPILCCTCTLACVGACNLDQHTSQGHTRLQSCEHLDAGSVSEDKPQLLVLVQLPLRLQLLLGPAVSPKKPLGKEQGIKPPFRTRLPKMSRQPPPLRGQATSPMGIPALLMGLSPP